MSAKQLWGSATAAILLLFATIQPASAQLADIDSSAPTYGEMDAYFVQVEVGPSFGAFIGGGAEESGAGFVGTLSVLQVVDDPGTRVGLRLAYDAYFFESIEGIQGQELREQIITIGAIVEFPIHEYLTAHAHGGLGGVISRGDVAVFPPVFWKVDDGGAVFDVGGGLRFYPARHVYLSGEININSVVGPAADLVDFNFRASALLGASF